jgi:ribonuclease HI
LKEPCEAAVFSDSQYVVNGITRGWAKRWRSDGWRLRNKQPTENVDLWEELLRLCEVHKVQFNWVKGHSGHPENECCDQLAGSALRQPGLPADTVYEKL